MGLSRREFLGLALGGAGAVIACACTGSAAAVYLLATRDADRVATLAPASPMAALQTTAIPNTVINPQTLIPGNMWVDRESWGGLPPNFDARNETGLYSEENPFGWRVYSDPLPQVYNTLVVHHTVIDEGDDLATLLEVQRLHREDRGWADVGYHYLVGKEGQVYEGRTIMARGAHTAGYNTGTVGVCLIGNFMESLPTEPQLQSTRLVVQRLASALQLTHLGSHRQFNDGTLCPGDNLVPYLQEFADQGGLAVGIEGYVIPATPDAPTSYQPHACLCECCQS